MSKQCFTGLLRSEKFKSWTPFDRSRTSSLLALQSARFNLTGHYWGETSMNFDLDGDWPSPGWSISFGKIVVTGVAQFGLLIEGNGMRHKAEFVNEQAHPTDASVKRYWSRTIDGSFILYAYDFKTSTGQLVGGYAKYRDGRESWFGAKNAKGNTIYLVKSRDVHGNYRGPLVFRAIYDGRRA